MSTRNSEKKIVAFDFPGYAHYLAPAISKIIPKTDPISDAYVIETTDYLMIEMKGTEMFPAIPSDVQMRSEAIDLTIIDQLANGIYVAVLGDQNELTIKNVVVGRLKEPPVKQVLQLWKDNPVRSGPKKVDVPVSEIAFLFKVNWYRPNPNPL